MQESRKTRYTRRALRQALVEALAERPIADVTVADLCRRADLSRGTFYLHYANPADLLANWEDDLFDTFSAPLREGTGTDTTFLVTVLRELAAHPDTARLIAQPGSTLVARFFAFKREQNEAHCRAKYPDLDDRGRGYVLTFLEQGAIHLIAEWIDGGMKEPPETIAALITRLT